jgi:topoisomerase IV subunit B
VPIAGDGTTGTAVRFRPDGAVRALGGLTAGELARLTAPWRHLSVHADDG